MTPSDLHERNERDADIFLSVVIPAYNEGGKIVEDLTAITSYLDGAGHSYEILVVDDGSADSTAQLVADFARGRRNITLLKNERNRGKGYSVKKGILASRGKYIGFIDAGLCVPPPEIQNALAHLNDGCDVAIGSRSVPGARIIRSRSQFRTMGSKAFALFVWKIMGLSSIADTQCGFKFYTREAARALFEELYTEGFMFDVEILRSAIARRYRIAEFPVTWANDPDSRFKLVSGMIRNIRELARIKFMRRSG